MSDPGMDPVLLKAKLAVKKCFDHRCCHQNSQQQCLNHSFIENKAFDHWDAPSLSMVHLHHTEHHAQEGQFLTLII